MSNSALTLEEIFEEVGWIAKWEARGEEKKAAEIARNLLNNGFSAEQTALLSGLDVETIRQLGMGDYSPPPDPLLA